MSRICQGKCTIKTDCRRELGNSFLTVRIDDNDDDDDDDQSDVKMDKFLWSYLPTPPLWQDMTQGQFLSGFY